MGLKVIKKISMSKFDLQIVELPSGQYQIISETQTEKQTSEKLSDYGIASFLFDMKLRELEGH